MRYVDGQKPLSFVRDINDTIGQYTKQAAELREKEKKGGWRAKTAGSTAASYERVLGHLGKLREQAVIWHDVFGKDVPVESLFNLAVGGCFLTNYNDPNTVKALYDAITSDLRATDGSKKPVDAIGKNDTLRIKARVLGDVRGMPTGINVDDSVSVDLFTAGSIDYQAHTGDQPGVRLDAAQGRHLLGLTMYYSMIQPPHFQNDVPIYSVR